jgi:hypothetical protein
MALEGAPAGETLEYPLFTDTHVVGEIADGIGPYQVLNCIPDQRPDPHRPALVLRVTSHASWSYGEMEATDTTRYHGGTDSDEFAALLSLCLGIRLKSGGATRWFPVGGDPRGRPWSFRQYGHPDPIVVRSAWGPVLPGTQRERNLAEAQRLCTLPDLSPTQSIALIRAARLYQDAVWIAESEPALAWLLLVSAVEAAAGEWRRQENPPREIVQVWRPDLDLLLEQQGGPEFAERVAAILADSVRATSKFVKFCITFVPPPPTERPPAHRQIAWTDTKLRKPLSKIYDYRSKALHEGTPFPAPMCMPPMKYEEAYAECVPGTAAAGFGGVWRVKDLPMYLHVFEYIARNALISWWDSLIPASSAKNSAENP